MRDIANPKESNVKLNGRVINLVFTIETRKKMSVAQKKRRLENPELERLRLEKQIATQTGQKKSLQHRKKLSEVKKELFRTGKLVPWNKGLKNDERMFYPKWTKKLICENCNSNNHVERHHLNFNKYDNRKENVKIWCRSCHKKWHFDYRKAHGLVDYERDEKGHILRQIHVKISRGDGNDMHI